MLLTYKAILKDLQKKKYAPIYFLSGEESYYIDKIASHIEKKILSESEVAFNLSVYYGKEIEFKQVIDSARQFPMMAPYRVVIIREAQHMRQIESLLKYVENPSPQTILVICYKNKKLDGRKKFGKVIKDKAIFLETKSLRDYQIEPWIKDEIQARGYKIHPEASMLLAEYLGGDLAKISSELDKLLMDREEADPIDTSIVQQRIGISKEYNVFELQKALGTRNVTKANTIMRYFAANKKKHPIQMINGYLFNYFSKLFIASSYQQLPDKELGSKMNLYNNYFIKDYRSASKYYSPVHIKKIFKILNEIDGKSKGIDNRSTSEGELMKELIMKIVTVS